MCPVLYLRRHSPVTRERHNKKLVFPRNYTYRSRPRHPPPTIMRSVTRRTSRRPLTGKGNQKFRSGGKNTLWTAPPAPRWCKLSSAE